MDDYEVKLLRDENRLPERGLLRVRAFSRFRNATNYQLWIAYRSTVEDEMDDEEEDIGTFGIFRHYCTCISDARTLGTCAHIASVIWFLGFARHEESVAFPPTRLTREIFDAAKRPPQEELNISLQVNERV